MSFPNTLPLCPSTVSASLKTPHKGCLALALPTEKYLKHGSAHLLQASNLLQALLPKTGA